MSPSICVSPWRRKPGRPRYYITDWRELLGAIYERRGIFTAITSDGNLVVAISSLRNAIDALNSGSVIVTIDWKKVAADAWSAAGWKDAAIEYHRDRTGHPLIVELEPKRLKRLRELLKDSISLSRAYYEISGPRHGGAPQPTVEALMYSLRERAMQALEEAATKPRLFELGEQQLHEICGRLQRLKQHIAPAWPPEQITILVDAWNSCHG